MSEAKIKILFIATSISGGGAERVLLNIINSLNDDKYEIVLAITGSNNTTNTINEYVKIRNYNKLNAKKAIPNLLKEICNFKPNYVFTTHITIAYLLPIFKIIFKNSFKTVIRIAVPPSEFPINNIKSKTVDFISKIVLKKADLIIAQTEFMKLDVIGRYNLSDAKVKVVMNVVNENFLKEKGNVFKPFEFEKSNFNIVASGALYSIKGFDLLIKAVAKLKDKIPNFKLYILGSERYEEGYSNFLQGLIEHLNLTGEVFLLGYKNNPFPYYKEADLFILSSRKEGFPNVVLENLYYQTPVVVTDCVDFTGILKQNINGIIVQKDSIDELEKGILNAFGIFKKPIYYKHSNFDYETIFI